MDHPTATPAEDPVAAALRAVTVESTRNAGYQYDMARHLLVHLAFACYLAAAAMTVALVVAGTVSGDFPNTWLIGVAGAGAAGAFLQHGAAQTPTRR